MKEPCSDTMLVTDKGIETIRVTSEVKVSQRRSKYKENLVAPYGFSLLLLEAVFYSVKSNYAYLREHNLFFYFF